MKLTFFALGSRGDVQPSIALAKKAIQNGHSAIICTGKTFEKLIKENGVEFKEVESDLMALLESDEGKLIYYNALKHPIKAKNYVQTVVNPAFRKTLDQFWAASQGADVIIYHPKAFGAPDMALALGIPCINMALIPAIYPIEEFPNLIISTNKNFGKTLNKFTYNIIAKAEKSNINQVNDFREKTLNLPKRKSGIYNLEIEGNRIPIIYPFSPILFDDVKSWKDNVFLPGFFYLDTDESQLDHTVKKFIARGSKPIVISFSSIPLKNPIEFKRKLKQALTETGNRAIILTGASGMTLEEDDDLLAIHSAPHTLLFPLAKGIVHHGGVGTMATALKSGKPQMIIPFAVDQPFWANLLYQKGYSLKPLEEKDIEVDQLISRFKQMEDEEKIKKAERIRSVLVKENGTQNALTHIKKIVKEWEI